MNKKRYLYSPLKFSLTNVSNEIEKHKGYPKGHYKDNTRIALIRYNKSMNSELDEIKFRNKKKLESAIEITQGKYEGLRGEKAIALSDSFEKIDNNFTNAEDAYKAKKNKYQSFTNVIVWFLMSVLALFHLAFFGSKIASGSLAEYVLVDSTDWIGLAKGTFAGINIWVFNGISRISKATVGEEGVINKYQFDTKSQDTVDKDNKKKEEEARKQIEKDLKNKEHLEKMRLIEEDKQKILRELNEQKQKTESERQERIRLEEQNRKQEQELNEKQKQLEKQKRKKEKQKAEDKPKKTAFVPTLTFVKQDVTLNKLIETISRETKFYSKTTIEELNDKKFKEATEVFLKDNIYNWYKRQFKSGSNDKSVETNTIKYKLAKYHLEKHQYDVSVDEGGGLKVVPNESKSKIA